MIFRLLITALLLTASTPVGLAQTTPSPADKSLSYHNDYKAAMRALKEGLHGVAATKLNRALKVENLPEEIRRDVRARLVEALVRSDATAKALEIVLKAPAKLDDSADMHFIFWGAHALAKSGRLADAEKRFAAVVDIAKRDKDSKNLLADAALARSGLLLQLGDSGSALTALTPLLEGKTTEEKSALAKIQAAKIHLAFDRAELAQRMMENFKKTNPPRSLAGQIALVRAQILLAQEMPQEALTNLTPSKLKATRDPKLREQLTLTRVTALLHAGKPDTATAEIQAFITGIPNSPALYTAFTKFEEISDLSASETRTALEGWRTSGKTPTAAFATFYLAIAESQKDDPGAAIPLFEEFLAQNGDHPLAGRAALTLCQVFANTGNKEKALELLDQLESRNALPGVKAHVSFLRGQVEFDSGNYTRAAEAFASENADSLDPEPLYNAAVTALKTGDEKTFKQMAVQLEKIDTPGDLDTGLLLERGLYAAANSSEKADNFLLAFLEKYPEHPDAYRASIALAERSLLAFPSKTRSATSFLDDAVPKIPTGDTRAHQQIDYIRIWIAESEGDTDAFRKLSNSFLQAWPESPLRSRVQMKLGEFHFRNGDFPNAQRQFELLNNENPSSPLSEAALFFAGKAASQISLDAAIGLWEQVVTKGGNLRLYAREQQALAKRRLGQHAEAIQIFDSILEADPPPGEDLRFSCLLSRGEALSVTGSKKPANITAAISAFEAVIDDPEANTGWREEALYRKGQALASLDRTEEALEAYYDIVNGSGIRNLSGGDRTGGRVWYYRAGFEAIRILEAGEKWEASIKIAERLAAAGGSRSEEAGEHADQLRLQHFLWDEE